MSTIAEIKKLTRKIEEQNELENEAMQERFELTRQLNKLSIKYLLEEKILNHSKWSLHIRHRGPILLTDRYGVDESIFELLKADYHASYSLGDKESPVELIFDDGDVYLRFENMEALKNFITDNNITPDTDYLTDTIRQKQEELDKLKAALDFVK